MATDAISKQERHSLISRTWIISRATKLKYSSLFLAFPNTWFSISTVFFFGVMSDELMASFLKFSKSQKQISKKVCVFSHFVDYRLPK